MADKFGVFDALTFPSKFSVSISDPVISLLFHLGGKEILKRE